jgi:putative membrane protein
MRFLLRLLICATALWVAVQLVPGISYAGGVMPLLGVALVFGVLNAFVRPVLTLLSLPFLILTLGLFTFVLNAIMLMLTSSLSTRLGLGFHVAGFWPALAGSLVVSLVSTAISHLVAGDPRRARG